MIDEPRPAAYQAEEWNASYQDVIEIVYFLQAAAFRQSRSAEYYERWKREDPETDFSRFRDIEKYELNARQFTRAANFLESFADKIAEASRKREEAFRRGMELWKSQRTEAPPAPAKKKVRRQHKREVRPQ